MIDWLIGIIITLIACGYVWLKFRYQYWRIRRVPYLKPDSLTFGNEYPFFAGKICLADNLSRYYRAMAPYKYFGVYHLYQPVLYIRDPDLIKRILVKDYHHFSDHSIDYGTTTDPLSRHLFNLVGDEWKVLRSTLAPAFSTGRLKVTLQHMLECAEHLTRIVDRSARDGTAVDIIDLSARFLKQVICKSAFGLDANLLHNPKGRIHTSGLDRFRPTWRILCRNVLFMLGPKRLRLPELPEDESNFFLKLFNDMVDERIRNRVVRDDFLDLLIAQQINRGGKVFDKGFIAAQCFDFITAGSVTSMVLITYILYTLAEREDIQGKLYEEAVTVLKEHDGQVTSDVIKNLPYMDKVISETLRLYTPTPRLWRICTAKYHMPDTEYVVERGQLVVIPISAIHMDAKHFPNPEIFDTERFADEAKASRHPFAYLPFGSGPRNCIAGRFALMEVKLAILMILKDYAVQRSSEKSRPLQFAPHTVFAMAKHDIFLRFQKRSASTSNGIIHATRKYVEMLQVSEIIDF